MHPHLLCHAMTTRLRIFYVLICIVVVCRRERNQRARLAASRAHTNRAPPLVSARSESHARGECAMGAYDRACAPALWVLTRICCAAARCALSAAVPSSLLLQMAAESTPSNMDKLRNGWFSEVNEQWPGTFTQTAQATESNARLRNRSPAGCDDAH